MKPEMILGPPGTGKTTTLLAMVKDLLKTYEPQEIAFVSFTRKAAWEARDRAIEKFPHLNKKDFRNFSTIHSMCFRRMGLSRQNVMGREDYKNVAREVNVELDGYVNMEDGSVAGAKAGDKFLFNYGVARARQVAPIEQWNSQSSEDMFRVVRKGEVILSEQFEQFVDQLEKYKHRTGKIDFNDMLDEAKHLGSLEDVKVAIIDEAQDLSRAQWSVIWGLFSDVERMVIAGDDDQAIFEWSGADVETFMTIDADRRVLDHSYRLPPEIHDFGNRIIENCSNRIAKDWGPSDKKGSVKRIMDIDDLQKKITDTSSGSWLVLARNAYLLNDPKERLEKLGIPMVHRGNPLIDTAHIGAIRTYEALRAGYDRDSSAIQRLYDVLTLGEHVKRGHKHLPPDVPDTLNWDALVREHGLNPDLKREPWFKVLNIPAKRVDYYRSLLKHGYKLGDDPRITLSTIHSVKGGEADNVVVLDSMSGRTYRDYQENADAEHRVFYVAATRARKNLYILMDPGKTKKYDFPEIVTVPKGLDARLGIE